MIKAIQNQNPGMDSAQMTALLRRTCSHLGIAFSANRVLPSLADLEQDGQPVTDLQKLNAVGKHFGIRFREMSGTMRDFSRMVGDARLLLVLPEDIEGGTSHKGVLILKTKGRNLFDISRGERDETVTLRWIRENLPKDGKKRYRWLLIQPMLAASHASRFHYESGTQAAPIKPLQRFIAFLKPEKQDIRVVFIFSVVIGLLSLTLPLAVEAVVNTIAFGRYFQPLIVLSFIVLVFLGFRAALNILMTIVTEVIQRKMFVRTVEDLSYRLTRVPLSVWKKYHGPELVNRFFDIVSVQKITAKLLLDTLMLALQTIIGLTVLAFYHPFLLGYDVGLLAMMTIILWVIGRGAVRTAKDESEQKYETAAWLQEIVRHPTTFKFNGGLGYAINRADELAAQYINCRETHFKILIRQITFVMIMQVIAATVLLALGGYLVILGEMTLGQLVAAELIVTVILGSFSKVGKDLESFYDLMASVDKLGKLFDLPVERIDKLQLARPLGACGLKLVDLKLDATSPAGTNLEFQPGETFAISGASELSRTKLIEVLTGQIRADSGHVLLDDFRVDAKGVESVQQLVSIIRDVEVFEGTVDENLRLGRQNIGSTQINDVVGRLGMRKILTSLPDGFTTRLSISGAPLSQGQAIRLVLARALITEPGILFVDGLLDRLSDQDTADVLSCLETFSSKTTIIISTGRGMIANWASQTLDTDKQQWSLESNDG